MAAVAAGTVAVVVAAGTAEPGCAVRQTGA
jgi:hypothetical protein